MCQCGAYNPPFGQKSMSDWSWGRSLTKYIFDVCISIILMKNRKNKQKPLYNEENGLY